MGGSNDYLYGLDRIAQANGTGTDYYRRMALEDEQITRVTRFCQEPFPERGPTLAP
jgi:hypothetical protein